MASKPSWLDDEENQGKIATSIASNPAAQSVAKDVAKKSASSYMPSWSKSEEVKATPVVATPASGGDGSEAPADNMPDKVASVDASPDEIRAMNNWRYIVSFCFIAAAGNLAVSAGLSLVLQTNVGEAFFAIYVIFFSGMILCFELAFGRIAKMFAINFGFMYTAVGKLTFVAFVGCMAISYSIYGIIAACILWASYLLYIYVRCTHPKYEEYMRKRNYNQESIRG